MPGLAAAAMTGAAIGGAIFVVVIQLVLGLVQWFKPNIVIPILFTVLVVYGLGSTVLVASAAVTGGLLGWSIVGLRRSSKCLPR